MTADPLVRDPVLIRVRGTVLVVLQKCYARRVKTISQRELRNDAGRVMREVERGVTFRVTTRGRPVAVLGPLAEPDFGHRLQLREGTQVMAFARGARVGESTDDVLAQLRGTR